MNDFSVSILLKFWIISIYARLPSPFTQHNVNGSIVTSDIFDSHIRVYDNNWTKHSFMAFKTKLNKKEKNTFLHNTIIIDKWKHKNLYKTL